MTRDQILDHATEPARVDCSGIEVPDDVRPREEADEQHRELGVLGVPALAVGQPIQHCGQLFGDLAVERRDALAQLRPTERRDADLGEQHAAVALARSGSST